MVALLNSLPILFLGDVKFTLHFRDVNVATPLNFSAVLVRKGVFFFADCYAWPAANNACPKMLASVDCEAFVWDERMLPEPFR